MARAALSPALNVFASNISEPVEGTVYLENKRADYVVGDSFPESTEDCSQVQPVAPRSRQSRIKSLEEKI